MIEDEMRRYVEERHQELLKYINELRGEVRELQFQKRSLMRQLRDWIAEKYR